jgi:DNA-directed RNA polymerase specialized sigma24 family protein
MPDTKHITTSLPYASSGDFHRIFHEEKDHLYQLSFMLTADHEKAQQCFVSGLEETVNGSAVFKEWASSWARRVIIQNAMRVINPRRPPIERYEKYGKYEEYASRFNSCAETLAVEEVEIAAVLDLEPFERFVFVMSVLEHYSEHECSILLGCPRQDVIAARVRALQELRSAMEFYAGHQVNGSSQSRESNDNCRSVVEHLLHV